METHDGCICFLAKMQEPSALEPSRSLFWGNSTTHPSAPHHVAQKKSAVESKSCHRHINVNTNTCKLPLVFALFYFSSIFYLPLVHKHQRTTKCKHARLWLVSGVCIGSFACRCRCCSSIICYVFAVLFLNRAHTHVRRARDTHSALAHTNRHTHAFALKGTRPESWL